MKTNIKKEDLVQWTSIDIIGEMARKAQREMNAKIDLFLQDSLGIKNLNSWTKLKLKFSGIEIKRQQLKLSREKISVYKRGYLVSEAEFNYINKEE